MAAAARSVSGSSGSKKGGGSRTCARSILGGPTTIDGTVFDLVKRCPLCQLCNTDANPVTTGVYSSSKFLPWARGTPECPVGRICKVCACTWQDGGFSAEHDCPDAFVQARAADRTGSIQTEWSAAYKMMIRELCSHETARAGCHPRTTEDENLCFAT